MKNVIQSEEHDASSQIWGESDIVKIRRNLKKNASMMLGNEVRTRMCVNSSDLVQETLMVTVKNLAEMVGRPKSTVFRWMITVMRHRILNQARAGRIRKSGECKLALLPEESVTDLLDHLINEELRCLVDEKIGGLDDLSQRIFELKYSKGLHHEEIATAVGLSKSAVRANLYRTLGYLKVHLKGMIT